MFASEELLFLEFYTLPRRVAEYAVEAAIQTEDVVVTCYGARCKHVKEGEVPMEERVLVREFANFAAQRLARRCRFLSNPSERIVGRCLGSERPFLLGPHERGAPGVGDKHRVAERLRALHRLPAALTSADIGDRVVAASERVACGGREVTGPTG